MNLLRNVLFVWKQPRTEKLAGTRHRTDYTETPQGDT